VYALLWFVQWGVCRYPAAIWSRLLSDFGLHLPGATPSSLLPFGHPWILFNRPHLSWRSLLLPGPKKGSSG